MVGVVSCSLYRRTHCLSRLAWSWVGGRLAPFYIHQMNRVNSRNGSAMMTTPQTRRDYYYYYYYYCTAEATDRHAASRGLSMTALNFLCHTAPSFDPLSIVTPLEFCRHVSYAKTRMVGIPAGETVWYVYSFRFNTRTWWTDGRIDRRTLRLGNNNSS